MLFRSSFKGDGKYLAHSIILISGNTAIHVEDNGSISFHNNSGELMSITEGHVRLGTEKNSISLSDSDLYITVNGKLGLTGTYTVTKSITVEAGIVVGVE